MKRVRIFPYNPGSKSAKTLSTKTGWLRLLSAGSRFRPRANDVIVNWGSTRCPDFGPAKVLNKRQAIMDATNKLVAIQRLDDAGIQVPTYWTSKLNGSSPETADMKIVARTVLNGHSGQGIVIGKWDELPVCSLYTKYIPKAQEFRVHVVGDEVIFTQRKARKTSVEEPNWAVRNLAGGFVYVAAEAGEGPPDEVAIKAVAALGLDFGAVDVILGRDGQYYVLEVNTACGLEERTADKYATAFKELLNGEAI